MKWLATALMILCVSAQANTATVAKCVAELYRHTIASPAKGIPFDIVAEVTFPYRGPSGSFSITDSTGSIALSDERPDRNSPTVSAGDTIRVQGFTDNTIYGIIYPGCRTLTIFSRKASKAPADGTTATAEILSDNPGAKPQYSRNLVRPTGLKRYQ